jgi:Glycosyltransferase family 87
VLAWRLFHDPRLAAAPTWLAPLLPASSGVLDRDPVALLLAAFATLLALAYAALGVFGARPAARAATIGLGAFLLVALPSAALVGMGWATDRPYGQDGGVVQLPLALERILAGDSPYGADYSGTILAREARVSSFWAERGGNPILHHHAYLPGTHLVMMPFYLASRAGLGEFDPRLVTLLFYALVVVLAARLPGSDEGRLTAAGVAALNPLVYWHQIFGANDLVLVAMVLGAVLAARRGRGTLAGGLLGLACATKQLAWPFAPFVLLALTGARRFRELGSAAARRRLARPALAGALVFAIVVLPVAALDFRAFWADIVAYNMGLPGVDNYPLGGTPGFGFANYLIYFGRVASLREHVSFAPFYLLLLPLGLLLLRAQMREGGAEASLVTGSVALVASVYFSRVVHPNYLIPAAVLLPLGVLARRLRADLALVPLLLLAVAVEIVENAVFRTTWEQAAVARLPDRLGGLAAALAPRAGPALTSDPLGLVFGASAAGLALVYLAVGTLGARARVREATLGLGVILVVVTPLLLVVGVGDRTGLLRAQDPAVVQAAGDAKRLLAGRSPYTPPPEETPRGREAFTTSFRLEPPAEIRPSRPLLPPGPALLVAAGRGVGLGDLRLPTLVALVVLAGLAVRRAGPGEEPTALALVVLPAPLAVGVALGSPLALPLAAVVGAWALARARHPWPAGLVAGLAVALDHRAALAVPLVLLPLRGRDGAWRPALGGTLLGYAAVVVPVALLDPAAFVARLLDGTPPGPGLGVFNVLAYAGAEGTASARMLAALTPVLAALFVLAIERLEVPPLAAAALATLGGLALAPSVGPNAVAVPLVLLGLASVGTGASSGDGRPTERGPTGRLVGP